MTNQANLEAVNQYGAMAPTDTPTQPLNYNDPQLPTPTAAGGLIGASGQGLINQQLANATTGAAGDDTAELMYGVGAHNSQGILNTAPSGNSLGMNTGDLSDALESRALQSSAQNTSNIGINTALNAPIRLAQRQAQAAGSLAEDEQVRLNNWELANTYQLQYAQLQAAQNAQSNAILGSVLKIAPVVAAAVAMMA